MKVYIEKQGETTLTDTLRQLLRSLPDGRYSVEVKRMRPVRSGDQNAYLWGCVYPLLLDGLLEAGWDFIDVEQVHEFFKAGMASDKAVNHHTGEVVEFPRSTARMDTVTFSSYCDRLRMYGREFLGIEIPDPDKYWKSAQSDTQKKAFKQ